MYCGKCGFHLSDEWSFCPICRQQLKQAAERKEPSIVNTFIKEVPSSSEVQGIALVPERYRHAYADTLVVVIGAGHYPHCTLDYVDRDVARFLQICDYLRVPADRIITATGEEANQQRMVHVLCAVAPTRIRARGRLIIFYAGLVYDHSRGGTADPVLLPCNVDPARPNSSGIGLQKIVQSFAGGSLYHCLMIVDAESSAFATAGSPYLPVGRCLHDLRALGGFQVLTAGERGQPMHQTAEHSLFMEMLVRGVTGQAADAEREVVTGTSLGSFVRDETSRLTNGRQVPRLVQLGGNDPVLMIPHTHPREKPTTSSVRRTTGTARLTSEPEGAFVVLDGNLAGQTPLEVKLAPGPHAVRITLPGYEPHSGTLVGKQAGESLHVRLGPVRPVRLPQGVTAIASQSCSTCHLPLRIQRLRDRAEMVLVPAGTFRMGSDAGPEEETPVHCVVLRSFYIDRYPVPNESYEQFMRACGALHPEFWKHHLYEHSRKPVVGISHMEAMSYCAWVGAMLPTEAQWERAALGPDGSAWPWGDAAPAPSRARYLGSDSGEGPELVDALPQSASSVGAEQMIGNVWEWCLDWFDARYYFVSPREEPQGPEFGTARVLRGGSWRTPATDLGITRRYSRPCDYRGPDVGFRCIIPCPEPEKQ